MGTSATGARVTFVVPTYKRPVMLAECLRAIQAQTVGDFVVLVCDNSEEQEARPVVAALEDPRFTYIAREKNLGIFGNAIGGMRAATTPFVMQVNDDDKIYPDCLETLIKPFVEHPDVTISFADLDGVDEDGVMLPPWRRLGVFPVPTDIQPGILQPFTQHAARGTVLIQAGLIRRDAIDWADFPPEVATAFDRFIALKAARGGRAAYYTRKSVVAFRVHPGADTHAHQVRQFRGALFALRNEVPHAGPMHRRAVTREVVRSSLFLMQAMVKEGQARDIPTVIADLRGWPGLPLAFTALTVDLVPQRIGKSMAKLRARRSARAARIRGT